MGSRTAGLTKVEIELLAALHHARGCDGIRCKTCDRIDRRLEDGYRYALEDAERREVIIVGALEKIHVQVLRLADYLEGAPVPAGARASIQQLATWVLQTVSFVRLPIVGDADVARTTGKTADAGEQAALRRAREEVVREEAAQGRRVPRPKVVRTPIVVAPACAPRPGVVPPRPRPRVGRSEAPTTPLNGVVFAR